MIRSIFFCLAFLCICGGVFAQEQDSKESFQSNAEAQFDSLDGDGDGMLSEEELDGFSKKTLGRMREKGLRQGYPLPRDEFVAATVTQLEAEEKKDREKDEERRQRKELKQDESSSASPSESAMSGPTGSRRNTTGKSRFAPRLSADYQLRDKNGDGQIGLYEWDRAKYAEFAKLDKNGDGFLTATELLSKSVANVKKMDGSKSPANQDPVEQDSIGKEARDTFARMDKNTDGGIAEDEWASSQRIRPMFDNAGITVSLPMDLDAFVANFRQVRAIEASRKSDGR